MFVFFLTECITAGVYTSRVPFFRRSRHVGERGAATRGELGKRERERNEAARVEQTEDERS